MSSFNESPETYKARQTIKDIFKPKHYTIQEEVIMDTVTNNIEENIWPPYRADMLLSQIFIIEFDSKQLHGTRRRRMHDQWRDTNILNQLDIPTVRLISKEILHQSPEQIIEEINYQLGKKQC